ncbi:MAG TPA: deoxyribonuclease IV [Planctomycetota bacterium]|nr:deoxyribonuclease IV [Planctomycetota bacterium]
MHLSFSSGVERAKEIGARVLQVFCGNPRGWQKNPLDPEFVRKFRAGVEANGISPVVVHATYLINLAARDEKFYKLSCESFVTEVARAKQIGAQFYVVHIGNHMGAGPEEGRKRVAHCLQAAVKAVPDGPEILVENTAGGGTTLGTTFEEVAAVMEACCTERMGLCLDTCHALAAGYDIRTPAGVSAMLDNIDRTIGLKRLRCLHLNDSKGAVGSHLDRHEHIGKGEIGVAGFTALFSDKRVWDLPAVLETPRDEPFDEPEDLWRAVELAVKAGAADPAILKERPQQTSPGAVRTKAASKSAPKAAEKTKAPKALEKEKPKAKMSARVARKKKPS